ncbi:MAG: DUF255 domain-containing protein [Alphaproteobacteria bacterium]|nr:DUF255 domain-containing protein [Alphaproteobacteria bacterium]
MRRNALDTATSPYLLQHKDNPVHWQVWSPETLAAAKAENKPILLSVGYAACHWCHVMAHESFENEAIAALMNEHFIAVKVDREERPDLDTIYQTALAAMGQQGGWPLTMFLTPDGEPFAGGTYFPPSERFGRPGFPQVLTQIAALYQENNPKIAEHRQAIMARLKESWSGDRRKTLMRDHIEFAARRTAQAIDVFSGGLDGSPKFPNVPILELLWRAYLRTRAEPFARCVLTSLDHMAQGGIYDHLGGGFARYSVDEFWLVPHFEKMLYDNAQLIDIYALVWQATKTPLYRQRIEETIAWALREMRTEDGGFASSLDADSEGHEGKFYVWSEAEIDALLTPAETDLFKQVYDVTAAGNFEGANILNRLSVMRPLQPEQEAALAGARGKLFAARRQRVRPGFDDKVLADWNGLMIAALANAAAIFEKREWHDAAVTAFELVARKMDAGDGRLFHVRRRGRSHETATIDDYAAMARAAVALYETTGAGVYLERARTWMKALDRFFWDDAAGGYFDTASDTADLIARPKRAHDSAIPNANGMIAATRMRLFALGGDPADRQRAEAIITAFGAEVERNLSGCATLLNALELTMVPLQVVIIGETADPRRAALVRAAYATSQPNRVLDLRAPGATLPPMHPAFGKEMVEGAPTAYVCVGGTCSAPVIDARDLEALLARPLVFP